MIRRLIALGLFAYAIVAFQRAGKKRAAQGERDDAARSDWETDGGSPAPPKSEAAA